MQRIGFNSPAAPPGLFAGDKRGAETSEWIKDDGPEVGMHLETAPGQFHGDHRLRVDMFAAEAVMDLKRDYPWIILEMVCPFEAQPARWAPEYQERYYRLMDDADMVTVISHAYTRSCIFRRNRYLVDNADLLLAAYDGQPGGTAMTVGYAREMGIPIQTIMPVAQAA